MARAQAPLEVLWTKTNEFGLLLPTASGYVSGGVNSAERSFAWVQWDPEVALVDRRLIGEHPVPWQVGREHPVPDGILVQEVIYKNAESDILLKMISTSGAPLWTNFIATVAWPPWGQLATIIPQSDGSSIAIPSAANRFSHFGPDGSVIFSSPMTTGRIHDVAVTSTGYYAAGVYELDFMLWSFGTNGTIRWQNNYGGDRVDQASRVQYSESERAIYVAGQSMSGRSGNKTAESHGGSDFWLVKVWENGEKAWDAAFGGTGFESPPDMTLVGPAIVLAGLSGSDPDGLFRTSPAFRGSQTADAWVAIIDHEGNKRTERSMELKYPSSDSVQLLPMPKGDLLLREGNVLHRLASPLRIAVSQGLSEILAVPGRPASFTAAAQSFFEPASYQWHFNNAPIAGATNVSLNIASVGTEHVGEYYVIAWNSVSEAKSDSARLTLTDAEVRVRMHPSLEIYGLPNRHYTIERTASGTSLAWEVADTVTLTNSPQVWVDASLNLPDQRLYRVKLTP